MALNSFFGNRTVIEVMLENRKAEFLASPFQRRLLRRYGHVILRVFGWPVSVVARHRAKIIFGYLAGTGRKTLDVGCSFGVHSFELSRKSDCHVVGIDIDQDNLKLAKQIKNILEVDNVSFLYGDILNSGFPSDEFDAVLMSQVIEHVKYEDSVVKEVNRILKSGGVFVVSTDYTKIVEDYTSSRLTSSDKSGKGIPNDLFTGGRHWRSGYNEERITSLLKNNGFRVLDISYVRLPNLFPQGEMLFPLTYPLSLLLAPISRNRVEIIVKAEKRELVDVPKIEYLG